MNRSERATSDPNAFQRAREYARTEMAERIAAAFPFSVAEVWLLLDELTEAEARQVCALAHRWEIAPIAASAVLDEQTGDIHAVLERRRIKPFRPSSAIPHAHSGMPWCAWPRDQPCSSHVLS